MTDAGDPPLRRRSRGAQPTPVPSLPPLVTGPIPPLATGPIPAAAPEAPGAPMVPTAPAEAAPAAPIPARPPVPPLPPGIPPAVSAVVEPPSPDVALADEASPLPGAHRGGFHRLPTAPVGITEQIAPREPGTESGPTPTVTAQWLMASPAPPRRGLAAWALVFALLGLVVSLFVGFGFPLGLVAIVAGLLALRRALESTALAWWAIGLGALSLVYSGGWLYFAATQTNLFD
ncbi:hypothetical protein [Microbacterium aurantiacum]|uniref:hypothetical protein n=1 Tax=Microbacterium aurantiacum TaxID=162393 RepID=UPI001F37F1D4|nr:hypothetical protein [Microbacterium aurantiacum]